MCPRYSPKLTDGINIRSLAEFRREAVQQGFVFEPLGSGEFRILDYIHPGEPKIVKELRRVVRSQKSEVRR